VADIELVPEAGVVIVMNADVPEPVPVVMRAFAVPEISVIIQVPVGDAVIVEVALWLYPVILRLVGLAINDAALREYISDIEIVGPTGEPPLL
jgi:hypothetical protein